MSRHRLALRLVLCGPVLTRSTSPAAFGVDAPVARNGDGRPVLPASLVKGKLREAWSELSEIDAEAIPPETAETWLGRGNEQQRWEPERGRLLLEDLVAQPQQDADAPIGEDELRYRIRIDDQLGAVKPNFLQVVESPFAAGEDVCFEGTAEFVGTDAEASDLRRQVEAGLRWVTSFGALRTVGFGRLLKADVSLGEPLAASTAEGPALSSESHLNVEIRVEGPLLISDPQPVANLFRSLDHIPGGVLKGALASTWNELLGRPLGAPIEDGCDPRRPELARGFEALRFTHSFPARREAEALGRPVVPPLSLAKARDKLFDTLLLEGPYLLRQDERAAWTAPAFAPDWKKTSDVRGRLGWAELTRELRVRTAIDSESRRAADEQLFAQEVIQPEADLAWVGRVDLSRVPGEDRAAVAAQLQELLAPGLRHLGKTQARASVHLSPAGSAPEIVRRHREARETPLRAVLLQTPGILVPVEALQAGSDLRTAYEEIWRELLGDAQRQVRLRSFFAAQDLSGGVYLHQRFQPGRVYEPFPLTRAGSVFLLQLPEDPAAREPFAARLEELAAGGLPLPGWAVQRYRREDLGLDGDHWRCCPYLPQNGYGEILLDLLLHWDLLPPAEHRQEISLVEAT